MKVSESSEEPKSYVKASAAPGSQTTTVELGTNGPSTSEDNVDILPARPQLLWYQRQPM